MDEALSRTARLIGGAAVEKLMASRVAVFGVGGVGGYVVEALARSGVGTIDLVDNDEVDITNLNRQIIALRSTVGRNKVDVARERILDINPEAVVNVHRCFFLPETKDQFDFSAYDYVVDAVDTVTAKIALVLACGEAGTPIISSMGAGNRLDPTKFAVSDLFRTTMDPLARVMRRELRRRGVKKLKVVCSTEKARPPVTSGPDVLPKGKRAVPGSVAFVPAAAGLIIAGEVVRDLTNGLIPDME